MTGFTLTPKQDECLKFLDRHIKETGSAPSFDQIAVAVNLKSKSGVHRIVEALELRGHIRRLPGRSRALEIVDQSRDQLRYLTPDVRRWVILRAQMNNMVPETMVAVLLRRTMDRETAEAKLTGAVASAGRAKDARPGRVA